MHGKQKQQIDEGRWDGQHRKGGFQHIQSIPSSVLPIQTSLDSHRHLLVAISLKMVLINAWSVNNLIVDEGANWHVSPRSGWSMVTISIFCCSAHQVIWNHLWAEGWGSGVAVVY